MEKLPIISFSGGKDSTAMLLLCLEQYDKKDIRVVFADTGNEHQAVYDYIEYIERKTGVEVVRLKRDLSRRWEYRKNHLRKKWEKDGVAEWKIKKALEVFEGGPTGNPFLDICVITGRFPSRINQFCTVELKKVPMVEYQGRILVENPDRRIESWQGVRAQESASRAALPEREDTPEGILIYRPILKWTWEMVFEQHRKHGIEPNPLYKQGMKRVGCMPCINCPKDQIKEISLRFPGDIDRIRKWEEIVARASKIDNSGFFHSPEKDGERIDAFIEWSKTLHGGKQYDLLGASEPNEQCASSYGLCELDDEGL